MSLFHLIPRITPMRTSVYCSFPFVLFVSLHHLSLARGKRPAACLPLIKREMTGTRTPCDSCRDAVARERELTCEAVPEVDRELAAQAEERAPMLRTDQFDRHRWNVQNVAERTSRIQLGVVLALLGRPAFYEERSRERLVGGRSRLRVFVESISEERW